MNNMKNFNINNIGYYVLPIIIFIIIMSGILKKIKIFDVFLSGASEGIQSAVSLAPSLIGLTVAVSMLTSSGALDIFVNFISPFCELVHIPPEVIPLGIIRPISGSGSIAILDNILETHGPDSFIGKLASIMSGSTETTFYTLTVYFGAVNIKNTRHTLVCALTADFIAFIMSCVILNLFS